MVTLGNADLNLNVIGGAIAGGTSFTLIDNDGTDAVNGIFAGLTEGSIISLAIPNPTPDSVTRRNHGPQYRSRLQNVPS